MTLTTASRILAAFALAAAIGAGGAAAASAQELDMGAPNCLGQHVSDMARQFGGIAAATAHHNAQHGSDLTVGEHMALMREMCAG